MAKDSKYGQITTEHDGGPEGLPDDLPVVVLRGDDPTTPRVLRFAARYLRSEGGSVETQDRLKRQANYIEGWQEYNADRVEVR